MKRRVVKVDTSNQRSLFDDALPVMAESEQANKLQPGLGIRFVDPDPRLMRLNEVRLDQHLSQAGQDASIKIRTLLEEMDWSGFAQSYHPGGRPPYAPRAMVGLILYGIMQGISSLRRLEDFARTDLGCMWISGGIFPDHSVIGRFVQRHEAQLSGAFFEQLTAQVLKVTGSTVDTVAGDGSIVEAAASRFRTVKAEALAQAVEQQRQTVEEEESTDTDQPSQNQRRLDTLLEAQQTLEERQQKRQRKGKSGDVLINTQEPEAMIQRQKDKKRFVASYKPSVLVNEMRIILGHAVDPGNENIVVPSLLEQAQRHGEINTLLLDAGYFNDTVITAAKERDIELLCPEGRSYGDNWNRQSSKGYLKNQFQYDPEQDCYHCPQGERLHYLRQYKGNDHTPGYRLYGCDACQQCPQKTACTRSAKGRCIKRYESDAEKEALREKMAQAEVRERYLKRQGMVEPVFGHLWYQQGLKRFHRKGLAGVRLEFSLHALAYNLSRAKAHWANTGAAEAFFRAMSTLRMVFSALTAIFRRPVEFSAAGRQLAA